MGPTGPMTMNPATYSKLPYSPTRDFVPVSMIGQFPLLLCVSASLPVNRRRSWSSTPRRDPNSVNYASSAARVPDGDRALQAEDRHRLRPHPLQGQRRLGERGRRRPGDDDDRRSAAGHRRAEGRHLARACGYLPAAAPELSGRPDHERSGRPRHGDRDLDRASSSRPGHRRRS